MKHDILPVFYILSSDRKMNFITEFVIFNEIAMPKPSMCN